MYKRLQNGRLYEQIVEQIESQVIDGTLKAGDRLPPERDLATRFGVSRTAVREAVKALRGRGLIEVYPGRGTFVTNGTSAALQHSLGLAMRMGRSDSVANLIELREMMEPTIAGKAAERATAEQITEMERLVSRMDSVLTKPDLFISADFQFHLILAEASQNHLLPTILTSVVDLLQQQRIQIFKADGGQARAQFHHKKILRMIKAKDSTAAFEAMVDHLAQVREDFDRE